VAAGGDDDELTAARHVAHRHGVAAARQRVAPEFLTASDVERTELGVE